jgi:hypothetical protein
MREVDHFNTQHRPLISFMLTTSQAERFLDQDGVNTTPHLMLFNS